MCARNSPVCTTTPCPRTASTSLAKYGSANSGRTYGHFGQSGTFLWVDPDLGLALVALTDRDFGDWTHKCWPALSDAVIAEFGSK